MESLRVNQHKYALEKKNFLWLSTVVAAASELQQTQVAELGWVISGGGLLVLCSAVRLWKQ